MFCVFYRDFPVVSEFFDGLFCYRHGAKYSLLGTIGSRCV